MTLVVTCGDRMARGFPPIGDAAARLLILGSLPGRESLARGEYYAQPRNAFWPIMGALFGAGPELPYARRLEHLVKNRVALWDVCAAARRSGSLDSAIEHASVVANDLGEFLTDHRAIEAILFNGATAAALYERFVLPVLAPATLRLQRLRLPSTSPANASCSYASKLESWRGAISR